MTQDKVNAALKVQEESILGRYDEFEKQIQQEKDKVAAAKEEARSTR